MQGSSQARVRTGPVHIMCVFMMDVVPILEVLRGVGERASSLNK